LRQYTLLGSMILYFIKIKFHRYLLLFKVSCMENSILGPSRVNIFLEEKKDEDNCEFVLFSNCNTISLEAHVTILIFLSSVHNIVRYLVELFLLKWSGNTVTITYIPNLDFKKACVNLPWWNLGNRPMSPDSQTPSCKSATVITQ
jgi:hypothetical protein